MRNRLATFLKKNLDVFAWCHSDMVGIDPQIMCHHLNIDPEKRDIRQKRKPVREERVTALQEEVGHLLAAGLTKESFYPTWLANLVLASDFTYLNKACPKDFFPLSKFDRFVDSTADHTLLSFMDTYSGYNQIPMNESDQNIPLSLQIGDCITILECPSDYLIPGQLTND